MKQIIVMIAMVMLGIAIAGLIGDFGKSAGKLTDATISEIDGIKVEIPATGA